MKKLISFLMLIMSFIFAGCSCSVDPFYMDDNLYNNTSDLVFIDLATYDEYKALLDADKSFAIFVHEESCGGCIAFTPVLTKYLQDKDLSMYRINVSVAKSQNSPIKEHMSGTPAVFLFDKGEYVTFLDSHSEDDLHKNAFKSTDGFDKWFTKYIILK